MCVVKVMNPRELLKEVLAHVLSASSKQKWKSEQKQTPSEWSMVYRVKQCNYSNRRSFLHVAKFYFMKLITDLLAVFNNVTTDMCHTAMGLQPSLLIGFSTPNSYITSCVYGVCTDKSVWMNLQYYNDHTQYTSTKAVSHICTFTEPLSGLVPGVPLFCGEDTHRVLSGSGSSLQDMVELLHNVTAWGCS